MDLLSPAMFSRMLREDMIEVERIYTQVKYYEQYDYRKIKETLQSLDYILVEFLDKYGNSILWPYVQKARNTYNCLYYIDELSGKDNKMIKKMMGQMYTFIRYLMKPNTSLFLDNQSLRR